jgi:hypothetical protein
MIPVKLSGTTSTGGTLTVNAGTTRLGVLYAAQLIDGSTDAGVDVTITCEQESLSIPLLVKADFNDDQMVYPRVAESKNTDGTASGGYCMPLVNGTLRMVTAGASCTSWSCNAATSQSRANADLDRAGCR